MTVSFCLPMPPSVNGLWANSKSGKGRYRTQHYQDWIDTAGLVLNRIKPGKVMGKVTLNYLFEEPRTKRPTDLGNREKATTDLLVTHGIIEGDDQTIVRRINMAWSSQVTGVHITIWPELADSSHRVPDNTMGTQESV